MKKNKLLIISDYYYPHWTGISKGIYYLVNYLSSDFDITILCVKHDPNLKNYETKGKVKILRANPLLSISRSEYSLSQIIKSFKLIKNNDYVLINSPSANILPISIITKVFRKRLVIFHQGDLILPNGILNFLIERIFDVSMMASFYMADQISTYTKDYAENSRIMKYFKNKVTPVIFPVKLPSKIKKIKNESEIKKLKSEGYKIFGFAGRFVEEKGFDTLFKAIDRLDKSKKIKFVFAGETNIKYEDFFTKKRELINRVKEEVLFLGLLDESQMNSFYNLIDFIIIPSRSDCFNLVQAEALVAGKPSIVSNIPGARYLVKKTGFGLIFKKEDPVDLANKIEESLNLKKDQKKYELLKTLLDNESNSKKMRQFIIGKADS